ncbi:MAG: hypothetical protein WD648_16410 [Planctomycetaceae bacterium]
MRNSRLLELNEKLSRPFPAPRRFGWIRLWHDESGRSFATAGLVVILIAIVALWLNRQIDTGAAGLAAVTIEQVVLGESEDDLQLLDERTESVAVHQTTSHTSLAEGKVAAPVVESPAGELKIQTAPSSFDVSRETRQVESAVQGLQESIRKIKKEPVELAGTGGISGILKVDSSYKSVVYVIDKSGSMASDRRLERVQAELIAGIQGLAEDQRFSIVFFDAGAWPMGSNGNANSQSLQLVSAKQREKQAAENWVRSITADGGTDPIPATLQALEANPELIVLLSDGEFSDPGAVDQITAANKRKNLRKARIDCIGIGEVVRTLQQLAQDNDGHYQPAR